MALPATYDLAIAAELAAVQDTLGIIRSNVGASAAPTVNDDSTQGYGLGSYWRRASTGRAWMCVAAAPGAAVWMPVTAGYKLPSGTAVHPTNVGSANPTGIGTNPVRTYSPVELGGLGTFSWEILLTTGQTGGEMRVAVYDCDEYGLPGKQVVAPVVLDLSVGTNAIKNAALGWTPPRIGRWWTMQHVKPLATQIVSPRIGAGLPGVIPAPSSILAAGNAAQIPRYLTSPEAYGSDPADATGLTTASIGSDCPVGWLKAA